MRQEEKQRFAKSIIEDIVSSADYSAVYENEELEDASEDDWQDIHNLILDAHVEVSW